MMLTGFLLATASVLDEHTTFEGIIQFDTLQAPGTAPGTVAPSAPAGTTNVSLSPICLPSCTSQLNATLNAVQTSAGGGSATGTCGTSCTSSPSGQRGLLQAGSTVTIVLTGASQAQAQQLQNNIAAGNLVAVGVPTTATVNAFSPSGAPVALTPSPVPLAPSNPSPANPASLCSTAASATITKLPCTTGLAQCTANLALLAAQNITAFCCRSCGNKQARQLQQTATQYALVASAPYATVCATVAAGTAGCGKQSKKGLFGLLGLLGLIPLFVLLLLCCLCLLRRKRRGQAMLFSVTQAPAVPPPVPASVHHMHMGPGSVIAP